MAAKPTYEELERSVQELERVEFERNRIREESLKRQMFLESVLYHAPDAIVTLDSEHRVIDWNPGAVNMFGYAPEETIGVRLDDLVARGEHHIEATGITRKVLFGQRVDAFETVRYRKDGTPLRVIAAGSPIMIDGTITGIVVIYTDITERVQSEERLRESEEKLRNIIEHSSNLFYSHTAEHELTYLSPQCREFLQCESEEAMIQWTRFATDNPINEIGFELTAEAIKTGKRQKPYELELIGKKGRKIIAEVRESPIVEDGKTVAIVGSLSDITDRKRAEEALRESELKYKTLTENSIAGIFIHQDDKYVYVNDKFAKMHGYNSDELLGMNHFDLIHMDQRDLIKKRAHKRLKGEQVSTQYEIKRLHKNGQVVWHEIMVSNPIMYAGKPAIMGHEIDITKRKLVEDELRESEEKYRLLFELESDVILLVRRDDDQILEVNNAGIELYGYTRDELLKMKNTDISAEPEETLKSIDEGRDKIPLRYHRKKDGTVFPVEISRSHFNWKGQATRISAIRDISDRIEAEKGKAEYEAQLRQMYKMEAIGTLAGGIAHDFNNILSIILGNTELAMDDVPEWNPAHSNMREIKKAGLRAKDVVRQLLSFSRKTEHERKPIRIAPLIKESVRFLRSSIPSSIEIRQNLSVQADAISGDPTQIHQVMINLCTNAAHAMEEEGGIMEISLTHVQLDESAVKQYQGLKPGPHVILSVSDTGSGIEPEIKDRLFDPYFTTKEVNKGTGMGLAVVHGIVKNHGGEISIESEPGKGTAVHVLFPAVEALEKEITVEAPEALPRGNERILLIDDESAIVKIGKQMLERLGYMCESKTSPVEAIELFQLDPTQFDLLITDMTMPHMNGKKLAEEILKIRPDIPIILCTGYSDKIDEEQTKEIGIRAYVMKPIVMVEIAKTIRQVLDGK
ncbi:MAG TPA: PAS domain S-box protein [Deltaproteobacteria bacterium]|nr:PAS domain S-box protein [Deltaproteobacteria bacterium]